MKPTRFLARLGALAVLFATLLATVPPAALHAVPLTLNDVAEAMGMSSLTRLGPTGPMSITAVAPIPGQTVYTIKVNSPVPACPTDAGCEADGYSIRYASTISNIYGLGMQEFANQVKVFDQIDNSFGSGHARPEPGQISDPWGTEGAGNDRQFDSDVGRMRTPILVLPEQATIIAYLQPALKNVRVARNGNLGCAAGTTCIDLKKRTFNADGTPDVSGAMAELVLVKGSTIRDAYASFYAYMRNFTQDRFYFKSPRRQAFGPVWETWDEFGCVATKAKVYDNSDSAVKQYLARGITPSAVIIGSGYWDAENYPGCPSPTPPGQPPVEPESNLSAMDTLLVSQSRYGGKAGLEGLFADLLDEGIYPMLGMRHQVFPNFRPASAPASTPPSDNFVRIAGAFAAWTSANPYLSTNRYFGNGFKWVTNNPDRPAFRLLDMQNPQVVGAWFNLVRYGVPGSTAVTGYASNVKGFKDDDMHFADQLRLKGFAPLNTQTVHNLQDGLTSQTYRVYNQATSNDFLIFGRNDWFSVGTDGNITQGWVRPLPDNITNTSFYSVTYVLDSALAQVASGYPHPASEYLSVANTSFTQDITTTTQALEFLRTAQLRTFFGVTLSSRGFWRLKDNPGAPLNGLFRESIVYSLKLRSRLQQYAYDNAQAWYETGVPTLMQPLYIQWPADSNVHALYGPRANTTAPTNEFMFGNALLIRPVLSPDSTIDVYLPQGKWRPFMKNNLGAQPAIVGPVTLSYSLDTANGTAAGAQDYPIYIKDREILIIGAYDNLTDLQAYVFVECDTAGSGGCTKDSKDYLFHKTDGSTVTLRATRNGNQLSLGRVVNQTVVESVPMALNSKGFHTASIATLID
ncbi:MAG TPA: hypothetical protein VD886_02140 [Herpetosiphonaceae bacterium]|nr:hypothetical protein [Herpetosiphonaceae bacterium]